MCSAWVKVSPAGLAREGGGGAGGPEARLMMFEVYKTAIAKFLAKPRKMFGDNMGVDVYLKECVCSRLHDLCVFDGVKIAVFW